MAPGMSCKYMVRFAPESLGGYEDFVTVETQGEDVLVVPIRAERHPPVLTRESDLFDCLTQIVLMPRANVETHLRLSLCSSPACAVPRVMECGYSLIGGIKFVEFMCQNVGLSAGKFCIVPKDQWPAWNIRVKNSP